MHYDLLSKIKNAQAAKMESFQMPYSNLDNSVAQVLVKFKYLKEVSKKTVGKKSFLEVRIAYRGKKPAMSDFKIMSKPGRHIYTSYKDLDLVRQGYGIGIVSTPSGIMSTKDARKEKVGGEYLCQVW